MKRFVSALIAFIFTLWSVAPVPAVQQELRTQGAASAEVRAGLEQRLLESVQPAAGLEKVASYADLIRLATPGAGSQLDSAAWLHENFKDLTAVFGAENSKRLIRQRAQALGISALQAVQGLLYADTLQGFLEHAAPQATIGVWQQYLTNRQDTAAAFVWEQRALEKYDFLSFAGGTGDMTNVRAIRLHPKTKDWEIAVVAPGSDNGGRTQRMAEGDLGKNIRGLRNTVGHPVYRSADLTAIFKGMFPEAFAREVLEPKAEIWSDGPERESFKDRVVRLLQRYVSKHSDWETETPELVGWAVELVNAARITDHRVIGQAYGLDTTSTRHALFDGLWVETGAYAQKAGRKLSSIDPDRFEVVLYLVQRAFNMPVRMLPNSVGAQDLVAVWENDYRAEGQVNISLAPDEAKRNPNTGQMTRIREFRFKDPVVVYPGLVQTIHQMKKGGTMSVIGPSSWVVSSGPTLLPNGVTEALLERTDLPVLFNVNLTRNNETASWTATDFAWFYDETLFHHRLPPERQIWVFNSLYPGSPWIKEMPAALSDPLKEGFRDLRVSGQTPEGDIFKFRGRLPGPQGLDANRDVSRIERLRQGESSSQALQGTEAGEFISSGRRLIFAPLAESRVGEVFISGQRKEMEAVYHNLNQLASLYAAVSDELRAGHRLAAVSELVATGSVAQLVALGPATGLGESPVEAAMRELLGTDLVRGQRWPAGVPAMLGITPEEIVQRFVQTWTARAEAAGVDLNNPAALRAYLNRWVIPWRIYPAGGRAQRVSATGLIRKPLVRPDGYSTTIQQAREPANWGGAEDVVVVDAVIAYHLLKDHEPVGFKLRKEIAALLELELDALVKDFGKTADGLRNRNDPESADQYRGFATGLKGLRSSLGKVARSKKAWHWTADPDQQGDVAHLLREVEGLILTAVPGYGEALARYAWEQLAYRILHSLVEVGGGRLLDPEKVRDQLGERVIVAVAAPSDGPGGALRVGLQRLKELGRLEEHAYVMPVYPDYAAASLDTFPNPYLIGLLAGLSNPNAPKALPKVVVGAKALLNSLPYAKGNVILVDSAHPGKGAKAIREWRGMTPEQQRDALEGFGRSLKQHGVAQNEIPQVENWGKLDASQQGAVERGYDVHTPGQQSLFYHAINAGIFIFEIDLLKELIAGGMWTPYGPYDYLDPVKGKLHEFWYTTVVEAAAANQKQPEMARVVHLGADAPSGLKDVGRVISYGAKRSKTVTEQISRLGVKVLPGATVTISSSSATFSSSRDLPRIFPRPRGVVLKGRVHLADTVIVGQPSGTVRKPTVLDGTEQPVVLLGKTVVLRGVTVRAARVNWQVPAEIPQGAVRLSQKELDFLGKLRDQGVMIPRDAEIYLLPVPGIDLSKSGLREKVLERIFEGIPDQVWLEGTVVLEPTVRIQRGTWLNGRSRPVILRGGTLVGQGRSVAASELIDTRVEPVPVLDGFNYRPPRVGAPADVWNAVLTGQVVEVNKPIHHAREGTASAQRMQEWYQQGRAQIETLRGVVDLSARVRLSPVWEEPSFSGWLGTHLQVRGPIEVAIESNRVLVWRLEGAGPEAHRVGEPVTLFQAEPGQGVVVPPGTVIDEQVFDAAVRESMAESPFRSDDQDGILLQMFRQQSEAGALALPNPGLPEPKTFPGAPYRLILRPGRVKSDVAPLTPGERPCPLCSAQWADNEIAYRRGAYILKSNTYPAQEGDMIGIALRHQPQAFSEEMLTDMVVSAGGAADDPVVGEADWLIRQLLNRKARGDPNIRGANVVVAGPGLYRTFYNDFDHSTSTSFGASIPEHAHFQGSPHPLPVEQAALNPIAAVGEASTNWVQGWAAPIFAIRSPAVTLYVIPRLSHDVPPLPPDPAAYLRLKEAQKDASGYILINPAAQAMVGSSVTSDRSSFKRAQAKDLEQLLSGAATPREALEPIVEAIRLRAEQHAASQTGLEELPLLGPRPVLGAEDFARLGGTSRPFGELALEAYVQQPDAAEALARNNGQLRLDAESASRLAGRPVRGGLIVHPMGPSGSLDLSGVIFKDSDLVLPNESNLPVVNLGSDWKSVRSSLADARWGDLVLPEQEVGLIRAEVEGAVATSGTSARVVVTSRAAAVGMTVSVLARLARTPLGELPQVVFMDVAAGLEAKSGEAFNLIVWN